MDTLIAEDLLLLLLDDDKGTAPNLWVDVQTPLTAAVLADLGLAGAVELEPGSVLVSGKLHATGTRVADPVLAQALEVVAEKPRTPASLVERTKKGLQEQLATRLADAGVLERHDDKVLGLFPRTRWPEIDARREQEVRERLRDVLLGDAEPDARTAVLAGILGALDRVPATLGIHGEEARAAKRRATAIAKGEWASKAVSDAVQAMVVATMTPVIIGGTVAPTSS